MTENSNSNVNFLDIFNQPLATPFQTQDLSAMKTLLDQINVSAAGVSKSLSTAFASAATSGKSFNDVLSNILESLAKMALRAGTQALTQTLVSSLTSTLSSSSVSTKVAARLADGGVVASPTFFGTGTSVGLMGERGAEAIMPLARGSDGRLGVVVAQSRQRPVAVTVNIAAQDIDSFRRSEAQITSALARAVARGQRNL
jgi:phage-related minor tail protein